MHRRRTSEPVHDLNLVYRMNRGRQPCTEFPTSASQPVNRLEDKKDRNRARTSMHAENLVVNDHGQCQEVEHVREVRPHVRRAILAHALRVKAVGLFKRLICPRGPRRSPITHCHRLKRIVNHKNEATHCSVFVKCRRCIKVV